MAVVKFSKQTIEPNPLEVDYWVDINSDPYGSVWKYHNGINWVALNLAGGSGGGGLSPFDYYTKTQINDLLADKADIDFVESKVDDDELAKVIQNIEFRPIGDNSVELVMLKYDGIVVGITMPVASETTAGLLSGDDFKNFVKQTQLLRLYSEMYGIVAKIREDYQPRLKAGSNIYIDEKTNTISATGELSVDWNSIPNVPVHLTSSVSTKDEVINVDETFTTQVLRKNEQILTEDEKELVRININVSDKNTVDKALSDISELQSGVAEAINTANTAKTIVTTLEGLANADEAMLTLAGQVALIEENKLNIQLQEDKITELGSKIGVNFINTQEFIPNIDTDNNILDLGSDPIFLIGDKPYILKNLIDDSSLYRAIPLHDGGNSSAILLTFNINNYEIKPCSFTARLLKEQVVIGTLRFMPTDNGYKLYKAELPFTYRIDGEISYSTYKDRKYEPMPYIMLPQGASVNYSTVTKKITIPKGSYLRCNESSFAITPNGDVELDLSQETNQTDWLSIIYNSKNGLFSVHNRGYVCKFKEYLIAQTTQNLNKYPNALIINCEYSVDGVNPNHVSDSVAPLLTIEECINFDSKTKILTIPKGTFIKTKYGSIAISEQSEIELDFSYETTGTYWCTCVYNAVNGTFSINNRGYKCKLNEYIIAQTTGPTNEYGRNILINGYFQVNKEDVFENVLYKESCEDYSYLKKFLRWNMGNRIINKGHIVLHNDSKISIKMKENSNYSFAVRLFKDDDTVLDTGWITQYDDATTGANRLQVWFRENNNNTLSNEVIDLLADEIEVCDIQCLAKKVGISLYYEDIYRKFKKNNLSINRSIRSIAHQGVSNTTSQYYGNSRLSSYNEAAKAGFDWGECDIKFTLDGIAVCCHDNSFTDLDSGQTITISDKTVDELKTYNYYSETIATFEEVLRACKLNGIGLYIDHLHVVDTDAKWNHLFSIVKKYKMEDRVVWMTINDYIMKWNPKAKISYVYGGSINQNIVDTLTEWKKNYPNSDIRLDVDYTVNSVQDVIAWNSALPVGICIEVWTIDNINIARQYYPYVGGITSNKWSEQEFR